MLDAQDLQHVFGSYDALEWPPHHVAALASEHGEDCGVRELDASGHRHHHHAVRKIVEHRTRLGLERDGCQDGILQSQT